MSNTNNKTPMTFGRFLAILSVILVFVALICAIVGTVKNQMDSDRHNYTKDVQVIDDIVHVTVRGDSMSPTINKDTLLIADKFDGNISSLSVGQIVTFKTQIYVDGAFYDSYDTKRIIQIHQDGTIIVRGDNQNEKNGRDWVNYTQSTDGTRWESISVNAIVAVCGEKHTHTFTTSVVAPTCTAGGYTTYTCFCGYSYKGNETVALGHSYAEHIVDATCTTGGYIEHICSRCGNAYNSDTTSALGHEYIDEVVAPTCTEDGYTEHTCSRCGDTYNSDTTSALGHDYEDNVVVATCTEGGYTEHTCSRCGNTYRDNYVEVGEHQYVAYGTIDKSCALSTYQNYRCSLCGDEKQEFVNIVDGVSNCHNDLEVGDTCEYCGYSVYSKNSDGMVLMNLGDNKLSAEYYGTSATSIDSSLRLYVTNVFISDSVTSIGRSAFNGCTGLTSITIPDSVTNIGEDAFYTCIGLTSITVPDGVTSIGDWAFQYCTGLTSVTIGNSVTSIGRSAFYGCTGLTSVAIPDSVTSIGKSAFAYCSNLTCVEMPDYMYAYLTRFKGSPWYNSFETETINGVIYINKVAIGLAQDGLPPVSLVFEDDTIAIGENAFANVTTIQNVVLPNGIILIDDKAFYECYGLTTITIPNSVKQIGDSAFAYTNIETIAIPDGTTSVGDGAFRNCRRLTSITIASSVNRIGGSAFYECSTSTATYLGTKAQWDAIKKGGSTLKRVGYYHGYIICSDGSIIEEY